MTCTPYTLYSGSVDYAPKEKQGEIFYWREEFDFFKDADAGTLLRRACTMQGEGLLVARGPRPEGAPKAQVQPLVALLELL
jgi:hypothetical protein